LGVTHLGGRRRFKFAGSWGSWFDRAWRCISQCQDRSFLGGGCVTWELWVQDANRCLVRVEKFMARALARSGNEELCVTCFWVWISLHLYIFLDLK
jgi:hypothetical protein